MYHAGRPLSRSGVSSRTRAAAGFFAFVLSYPEMEKRSITTPYGVFVVRTLRKERGRAQANNMVLCLFLR